MELWFPREWCLCKQLASWSLFDCVSLSAIGSFEHGSDAYVDDVDGVDGVGGDDHVDYVDHDGDYDINGDSDYDAFVEQLTGL